MDFRITEIKTIALVCKDGDGEEYILRFNGIDDGAAEVTMTTHLESNNVILNISTPTNGATLMAIEEDIDASSEELDKFLIQFLNQKGGE